MRYVQILHIPLPMVQLRSKILTAKQQNSSKISDFEHKDNLMSKNRTSNEFFKVPKWHLRTSSVLELVQKVICKLCILLSDLRISL